MSEGEQGLSREYGRIPAEVFVALWRRADVTRFRYRPIRIVSNLIALLLGGLWAFYLYRVLGGAGFTAMLLVFGLALVGLSVWATLRLMVWRLFVRRSGIVMTEDSLVWRQGPLCFLAPWDRIEPEALGLDRVAFEGGYDNYLTIQVGDTAEPLYLVRLYAKLEDIEGFMAELLKRIPREKWKKAGEQARKKAKKGKRNARK